jgi:hypothetical protein
MSIFIKAGLWIEKQVGYKGEFNLTRYITDLIASSPSGSTYKVYTALLNQTGTNDPVATILENTLGENINWSYANVGIYLGTIINSIDMNKTGVLTANNVEDALFTTFVNSTTEFEIRTKNLHTGTPVFVNDYLNQTLVEIRVYN